MARQFRASIDLGTNQIKNVVDPTAAQDAATKAYVDSVVNGLVYKKECRAATTAALATVVYANGASGVGATLTGASVGALGAIDGITLAVGERLLVKNQVDQTQNGAYTVTATGSSVAVFVLTRATDSDMAADYASGAAYYIVEGTINGNTTWAMSTEPPITMGTTSIAFAQVDGPGSTLAGNGLSRSGNTISIDTAITATVNNPTFTGTTTAPEFSASGLTGATSASRYVGATATGSPASGTFVIGDFVIARDGHVWICIVGGSPGAWADVALQGSSDVQAFSANGTWTKQANAVWVEVIVVGSGGGGGGGRLGGAAGIRGGGGGGGPGQVIREEFQAADLTATVAVTIPAGGTAGVGRSGAVNSGGAGGTPAATTFGAFMSAAGGVGGGGGTGAAGGAGGAAGGNTFTPSWVSQGAGAVGATGGVGAGISAGGGGVAGAPGAGGAGGGMSAANAIDNGSAGGGGGGVDGTNAAKLAGGAGGSGAGAAGTAGTASGTSPSSSLTGGSGGGGGAAGSGASNATGGGAGQNGGTWGAGGGGGGAGTSNGTTGTSGAGGTGGKGYVIVISHR